MDVQSLKKVFVFHSISEYYEYGHGSNDETYNSYGECYLYHSLSASPTPAPPLHHNNTGLEAQWTKTTQRQSSVLHQYSVRSSIHVSSTQTHHTILASPLSTPPPPTHTQLPASWGRPCGSGSSRPTQTQAESQYSPLPLPLTPSP